MTGCGKEEKAEHVSPFEGMNLEEYITLPDYNVFTVEEPEVNITEDQIDDEIQARLEAAAETESVTEGTVNKGDTVLVDFEGILEDGTSSPGMSAEDFKITLGNGGFIDGFEEGIYGAKIGETVSLDLAFPDPYPNNPDLAGKPVTFKITVNSKEVPVVPQLDEDFIKANSSVKTEAEYRDYVKGQLEQVEFDNQLYNLKEELYNQIVEETEVLKYPEEQLDEMKASLLAEHEALVEQGGYADWDEFRNDYFGIDQAEYDEQLKMYAESLMKQEMIIYLIAENEAIEVTDEEYQESMDGMLAMLGLDAETFKAYIGVSIEEYAQENNLYRDLLLTKELDVIYDRLLEK